jgi:hypothetical protein
MMALKAREVFVPGAYPQHTYIKRAAQDLETALSDSPNTPGQIVSLSGPSKSGKTVLVEKVVGRDFLIPISGASLRHPDDVWQHVLDWINVPSSTSAKTAVSGALGGEATAKAGAELPLIAKGEVGGSVTLEVGGEKTTEAVRGRRGLPQVVHEIANSDFVVLLDDFHYMERSVQAEVAKSLKEAVRLG